MQVSNNSNNLFFGQANQQNNDLLLGKVNTDKDASKLVNNSFKDAGINVFGGDISQVNSDHLMSAYVMSSLGFSNDDKQLHENAAVVSSLNLNTSKYMDIINGDDFVNPARPSDEINKTSQKIADFVINNADGDLDKLYQGKAGVIDAFNDARKMQGANKNLNEIFEKTISLINDEITKLGGNVIDFKA